MAIHEYYTKMKTTLYALRAAESNMSDEDFVLCLLARLGSEYDLIVTTINAQPEGTTLSNVYRMLLTMKPELNINTLSVTWIIKLI